MTNTWDDMADVPDGVVVIDVDGDKWRHDDDGLEWKPEGADRWYLWTDDITPHPHTEYAPYRRVSR